MKVLQYVLAARPEGVPDPSVFRQETVTLPTLKSGDVHLQSLYYSVDPYMRGRMRDAKSYIAPFELEKPIQGGVVARVVETKSDTFKTGDVVLGMLPWATECVVPSHELQKLDASVTPLSSFLGILGMPGMTAYVGLLDIGRPKANETVVVSGAAGAVGATAGQIAKIKGCRVVGIVGSDSKATLLREECGYDDVINYRTCGDLGDEIKRKCPKGVPLAEFRLSMLDALLKKPSFTISSGDL
jgi:NADPH-dependent curcumin reductase CurA